MDSPRLLESQLSLSFGTNIPIPQHDNRSCVIVIIIIIVLHVAGIEISKSSQYIVPVSKQSNYNVFLLTGVSREFVADELMIFTVLLKL